jgi:hypothetical protein
MATAESEVTTNSTGSASVDIEASPTSSIITATNLTSGDTTSGVTNISNTGSVDEYYFVSADWTANSFNETRTSVLANTLNISVSIEGTNLYDGTLAELIDQPDSPGRSLAEGADEDVELTISMPTDAGSLVNALDINVDFVFVATD